MRLLEFTLAESLDRDNPWVRRIVFGGGGRWWFLRTMPLLGLYTVAPLYAILWILALTVSENSTDIVYLCTASAYLLLLAAFVAPAAGVGARYRLDRSRMLRESFQTPLPWRAYVAAVHGRVIAYTAYASALAFIFGAAYLAVQFHGTPNWRIALEASQIAAIADMLPAVRWRPNLSSEDVAQIAVLVVLMVISFASGVYARASINAAVRPIGPAPVIVTGLLLGVAMASFSLRYFVLEYVSRRLFGMDETSLRFLVGLVEIALVALRLAIARAAWRRLLSAETQERVISQAVGAP